MLNRYHHSCYIRSGHQDNGLNVARLCGLVRLQGPRVGLTTIRCFAVNWSIAEKYVPLVNSNWLAKVRHLASQQSFGTNPTVSVCSRVWLPTGVGPQPYRNCLHWSLSLVKRDTVLCRLCDKVLLSKLRWRRSSDLLRHQGFGWLQVRIRYGQSCSTG